MAWNVTDIRKSCHICKKTKKRSLMIEGEAVGRDQQGLSESKKSPKRFKKKKKNGGLGMYVSMQETLSSSTQHHRNQLHTYNPSTRDESRQVRSFKG